MKTQSQRFIPVCYQLNSMPVSNRKKNQHLLCRAAFGPMLENLASLEHTSQKDLWQLLLTRSNEAPAELKGTDTTMEVPAPGITPGAGKALANETKKILRKQAQEQLKSLNLQWLNEMIHSQAQLRERMSLFWHGHFACRINNPALQQQLLHTIRMNSLGSFGDILKAVSKSPAMLRFLNNQQNRKQKPNENFAREVMELFTLGRAAYTEADVKEAARAFTGWGFDAGGQFVVRQNQHDTGNKTFLGKSGNFDGDDILNILLEQKATANFITRKFFRYFVNEEVSESKITWLSNRFYQSGYNIKSLLQDIFTSEWFFNPENIGTKIKSPIDLIVGIRRYIPMDLNNEAIQLLLQRSLGQVLMNPPNVAGWPGGKNWIDSSTLLLRMQLPKMLMGMSDADFQPKQDDDQMMGQGELSAVSKYRSKITRGIATVDWQPVIANFEATPRISLFKAITNSLIQTPGAVDENLVKPYLDNSSRQTFTRSAIIHLMSTPEYQLS